MAQAFWAHYLIVLHAIAAIAIVIFLMEFIDGQLVDYANDQPWYRRMARTQLQSDDIITMVSAASVVIRIITGAWVTKSAWRCALILLETRGITLRQFSRMTSWPAYLLGGSADAYIATLILLLLVPANLVSPVITGSIGWNNAGQLIATTFNHTWPGTSEDWAWIPILGGIKAQELALFAATRAEFGWQSFGGNGTWSSRLFIYGNKQLMPVNSVVDNVTLPFLEIHDISWDKTSDFKENITDELNFGAGLAAASRLTLSGERPFTLNFTGNAALFDENFLDNYPGIKTNSSSGRGILPSPTVFRGTKKVAVLVSSEGENNCSALGKGMFGNRTSMANLKDLYSYRGFDFTTCFRIGTVNFTAGVIRKRATFILKQVLQAEVDSPDVIEGDSWVIETLYRLPDVMSKVALVNVSQIPTWDNLDGYVESLIQISYQTTWGELTNTYNSAPLRLTAHEFTDKLQAVVSRPRVFGWYGAQFLVLPSAALLWMLQRRSERPIAIDTGVVALLVDASPVLDRYDATRELSKMSYVMRHDGGRVKLVERSISDNDERVKQLDEPGPGAANPPRRFMLCQQAESE